MDFDNYPTPAPSTNPYTLNHQRLWRKAWVYKLLDETLSDLQISRMRFIIQFINGGTVYVRKKAIFEWSETLHPTFLQSGVFFKVV